MIKIVHIGMGPLGRKIYLDALKREHLDIVGVVDMAPDLIGVDMGALTGGADNGQKISGSVDEALHTSTADVAVVTTVSDMARITPLILDLVRRGIPVVSTCEELSYPWDESAELSERIDEAARKHGVAVLGTGVNPGFLMDTLPAQLTAVCHHVEKIEVRRFQNAAFRRIPFQKKIGAGLTLAQFAQKKDQGTLRHVGLTESMEFIASRLGWKLDHTEDVISPVVADDQIVTDGLTVEPGQAAGVRQEGRGFVNGVEKVTLIFQAAVGEAESYDEVLISGRPDIHSRITGGVHGDIATSAITLNAVASILEAKPGLRIMADVPMVSCRV